MQLVVGGKRQFRLVHRTELRSLYDQLTLDFINCTYINNLIIVTVVSKNTEHATQRNKLTNWLGRGGGGDEVIALGEIESVCTSLQDLAHQCHGAFARHQCPQTQPRSILNSDHNCSPNTAKAPLSYARGPTQFTSCPHRPRSALGTFACDALAHGVKLICVASKTRQLSIFCGLRRNMN